MTCKTTNVDNTLGLALNRSAASRPETPNVVRSRTATMYASSRVAQTIQGRTPNLSPRIQADRDRKDRFDLMSLKPSSRIVRFRCQWPHGEITHPGTPVTGHERVGWNCTERSAAVINKCHIRR